MAIMTALGVTCAALAGINGFGALVYGWHGQAFPAVLMMLNFAVLGGLVQVGVFG